jgi:thiamine-monophosphate kinase
VGIGKRRSLAVTALGGHAIRVGELGEDALVARIAGRIGPPGHLPEVWAGDDAAVFEAPGRTMLYTTDLLVEGVDFDLGWCAGGDVGWKAVAVNASDVAAMGGLPRYAVVALALPSDSAVALVDDLVEGMLAAASRWGIAVVGGDVSEANELSLSVALIGVAGGEGPVLRSGARPGEAICVTGSLGGARAGLVALEAGAVADSDDRLRNLVLRQLRPQARVDEGVRLAAAGASAMIDLSDGLVMDLGRLVRASGTGCEIDPQAVPVDPAVAALAPHRAEPIDFLETAILGGEDFELLLTIDEDRVASARRALEPLGTPLTRIGTVKSGDARIGGVALERWEARAWQHLRDR